MRHNTCKFVVLAIICFVAHAKLDKAYAVSMRAVAHRESKNASSPSEKQPQIKNNNEADQLEKETKNQKETEADEDDEVMIMKNLGTEINNRERLQSNEKTSDKKAENKEETAAAPGCSVLKTGVLEVETDPSDVLKTEKFNVSITENALILSHPGQAGTPYKRFSLPAIQMPLETLDRARDCFRLFYKGVPSVFCGSNTTARDEWAGAIIEAIFCFNSGTAPQKASQVVMEKGKEVKLPAKSTKETRWQKLEEKRETERRKDEEESSVEEKPKGEQVSEIEIVGVMSGSPKVTLNGEAIPLSFPQEVEEEDRMGKSEF